MKTTEVNDDYIAELIEKNIEFSDQYKIYHITSSKVMAMQKDKNLSNKQVHDLPRYIKTYLDKVNRKNAII
jgi:hypothetical protein